VLNYMTVVGMHALLKLTQP